MLVSREPHMQMQTLALATATDHARPGDRWSVPQTAAFVVLVSGALWMAIVMVAGWLIA